MHFRCLTARWIPHLLADEQKKTLTCVNRPKVTDALSEMRNNVFNTFVTGDETWVHFFRPRWKVNDKRILTAKIAKRPCVAKRLQSTKKLKYTTFFTV